MKHILLLLPLITLLFACTENREDKEAKLYDEITLVNQNRLRLLKDKEMLGDEFYKSEDERLLQKADSLYDELEKLTGKKQTMRGEKKE